MAFTIFCENKNVYCFMQFSEDAYKCRECLGWNKVIPLTRIKRTTGLDKTEILDKIYANVKVNNIGHELIMTIDKLIQINGWEFRTAADRDFVMDETLKYLLSSMHNFIKEKEGK